MGVKTTFRALLLLALVLLALLAPAGSVGWAAGGGGQRAALDELLLYWDEKDLYVESATRCELPRSQVAENVTVITAREIEALHAHSVAEVLNTVPGIFVLFQGRDFSSPSNLLLQGASERHTLVLVDGVPWNQLGDNHAETLTLPVAIIERIEIVKGPASSAWGSALGGVVNILTKAPGSSPVPHGTVSASYGERNTQDYGAELSGAAGPLGYYLHGGHRESEGLRADRSSRANDLYGKLRLPLGQDVVLGLTASHGDASLRVLDLPEFHVTQKAQARPSFGTLSLNAGLAPDLRLTLSAYALRQKIVSKGEDSATGEVLLDQTFVDRSLGGTGKVVWSTGRHTLVVGTDLSHGEQEQNVVDRPSNPSVDRWAVFANDTLSLGDVTVTPGLRYDRNSISGGFTSPSLGATWQVTGSTLLRAFVARGFTYPPLAYTSVGDGRFLQPNPDLEPEKVWSYQAGAETALGSIARVRADAFYHRQTDAIERVWDALGPGQDQMRNVARLDTQGVEVALETVPRYDVSLRAGATVVRLDPAPEAVTTGKYSYALALTYDDRVSWRAQWSGVYKRWLVEPDSTARSNGVVWDFTLDKRVFAAGETSADIFFAAHNVFNASAYASDLFPNPGRWVEGGIRFHF
ncbi:MAG: TonB-dependent receptor [Deltaproteobacteria bacterium]|nr:TonB-dependent receptor [Deltaproteobacteria bacterium]